MGSNFSLLTRTSHLPSARFLTSHSPLPFVLASGGPAFRSTKVRVTVAPPMALPAGSVTVPLSVALPFHS